MSLVDPHPDERLVLVAGAGRLPELVADSLDRAGRSFRVLAIRGFAERPMRARADVTVDLLDIAGALAILEAWGPACVIPVGGVSRPNPAAILNAAAALRNREALRAISGGGTIGCYGAPSSSSRITATASSASMTWRRTS